MSAQATRKLLGALEALPEERDDEFDDIPGWDGGIVAQTDSAVLLHLKEPNGAKKVWFPLSQLRRVEDQIYASKWILEQKGLAG